MPRVIVFITDSATPVAVDGALLQHTYGLTPAEIRVAVAMAEGLTVEEAATQLGVMPSTVTSQLKQVYAKTGTDNRAKLVKLMMSVASA